MATAMLPTRFIIRWVRPSVLRDRRASGCSCLCCSAKCFLAGQLLSFALVGFNELIRTFKEICSLNWHAYELTFRGSQIIFGQKASSAFELELCSSQEDCLDFDRISPTAP